MTSAGDEHGYRGQWHSGISVERIEREVGEEREGVFGPDSADVGSTRSLWKEMRRVSPRGFVKVKRAAALLFYPIHSRVRVLQ